jgi:membrane associated rhomboid family serine protease
MERLLARLERRFGAYAVENLILYIVGGMAIVWILAQAKPEFIGRLTLDMRAVGHRQPWRLVTFLFVPPDRSPFWILVNLYFTWWVGSSLEQQWGAFKFNAYVFLSAVATIVAATIVASVPGLYAGPATNAWLLGVDGSLLIALATVSPNEEILLSFVLPIRLKWVGVLAAVLAGYMFLTSPWGARASILAALAVYALFFAEHWMRALQQEKVLARQSARRASLAGADTSTRGKALGERVCAICGAREADGADIRVCSCEKCGRQPRSLCLEHARNH